MAAESTRSRIIEAAGPIFAEQGFEKATVREICAAAKVNVASINYYFGDKQQLYLETLKYARTKRAERYPVPAWDDETLPEEKLYDMVSTLLRRLVALKSAPWQVQMVMREVMNPSHACEHLVLEYFRPYFELILEIIDELCERPLPDDVRLKLGFSIIGQCLHYRYGRDVIEIIAPAARRGRQFEPEQLADHITQFSLGGIKHWDAQLGARQPGYNSKSTSKKSNSEIRQKRK